MKKILLTSIVFAFFVLFFPENSEAGKTCSTDAYENTRCYGTGDDSGYNSTTTQDAYGNTRTYDSQGNTETCSTDAYGNTRCY